MNKFKDARSTGQKEENTMGKYEQDARLLLEYVGGKENIAAVSHCVSRMRFVLNDPAKADVAKIETLKSAKGTFTQAGQFQVIIGNTVNDFYNDSIRSFYKTLVALRKKMPVISAGKIEFLYPDNADLLAYRRYDGETELLVLCNLREREIAKPLPVGWTDAEKLLGNYPDTADTLRPYECVVLKK